MQLRIFLCGRHFCVALLRSIVFSSVQIVAPRMQVNSQSVPFMCCGQRCDGTLRSAKVGSADLDDNAAAFISRTVSEFIASAVSNDSGVLAGSDHDGEMRQCDTFTGKGGEGVVTARKGVAALRRVAETFHAPWTLEEESPPSAETCGASDFDPLQPLIPPASPCSPKWKVLTSAPVPFCTPCGIAADVPAFSNGKIEFESLNSNFVHLDGSGGMDTFWHVVSQCELGRDLNDISDGDDTATTVHDTAAPTGSFVVSSQNRHGGGQHQHEPSVVRVFSGMRWECLEYARRYYICHYNVTFPSLSGADKLWDLETFTCVRTQQATVPILKFANGVTSELPAVGDMLVYPYIFPEADLPHGHVAIVAGVHLLSDEEKAAAAELQMRQDEETVPHLSPEDRELRNRLLKSEVLIGCVLAAEQNWDNCVWTHITFSRRLSLVRTTRGDGTVGYRLCDCRPYRVTGWMRCGTL